MIKGIFLHDLPIYKDVNGIYCSTTMTDDLFSRYLEVMDVLYVATRVYPLDCSYVDAHQEKITLDNVKIIEFPNMNTIKGFFTIIPDIKKKLIEIINDMDLIIIRGGTLARIGAQIAIKLHKPYLIEVAGCEWEEFWNYSLLGKIVAPYMELSIRWYIKKAAFAIYVTEYMLQHRYPTKGISTYASNVILTNVDSSALESRLLKIQNKPRKIILGTTGGISNKAKGQHFVMEAMKILSNKYDLCYELVGGGDNTFLKKQSIKYGVSDRVSYKGQLNHDEVLQWLDHIDVYIQPSMQEGLPRSVIEALSRGCPVIGANSGGTPELIDPKYVFKRGNVKDLSRKIELLLNDDLSCQVIKNFNKSKEYELGLLNARRKKIYEQYRDFVLGKEK